MSKATAKPARRRKARTWEAWAVISTGTKSSFPYTYWNRSQATDSGLGDEVIRVRIVEILPPRARKARGK